jgi:hypothetical protein
MIIVAGLETVTAIVLVAFIIYKVRKFFRKDK